MKKLKKYDLHADENGMPALVCEGDLDWMHAKTDNVTDLYESLWLAVQPKTLIEEKLILVAMRNMKAIAFFEVSSGGLTGSIVDQRSVAIRLLLSGATECVMAHNHPGGDIEPSKCDNEATRNVYRTCEVIGIPLVEHIILGNVKYVYYSYAEEGDMEKISQI